MTPIRTPSLLAVALAITVVLASCGGDESGGEEPASKIQSGVLDGGIETSFRPRGGAETGRISFSGPFESKGDELPRFNLAVRMQETEGDEVDFGMIATADAGYIEFQGQGYEIDEAVFEELGAGTPVATLDPTRWFASRSEQGRKEIDGTETIHTSGRADVEQIFPHLEQAARELGLEPGNSEPIQRRFDEATLDLYTGAEDGILRRLDLSLQWDGSSEEMGQFTAVIEFSMTVTDVNEDQEIDAPEDPAPFTELVDKLPLQLSGLGEFLSGG